MKDISVNPEVWLVDPVMSSSSGFGPCFKLIKPELSFDSSKKSMSALFRPDVSSPPL